MNLLVRAVLSAAGRGFGSLVGQSVSGSVDCTESWERGRDAFRPRGDGKPFTPLVGRMPSDDRSFVTRTVNADGTFSAPVFHSPSQSSPGAVEASQRPAPGESPTQEASPPTPSCVGQPLTRAELQCAAFVVREWGASCGIGFGHQFWGGHRRQTQRRSSGNVKGPPAAAAAKGPAHQGKRVPMKGTTNDTQLLAELEHTIEHPPCGGRPDCQRDATHVVRTHQIDHCMDEQFGSEGAFVQLLCMHCLAGYAELLIIDLVRWNKWGRVACLTCGRPIECLHDVLDAERIR